MAAHEAIQCVTAALGQRCNHESLGRLPRDEEISLFR